MTAWMTRLGAFFEPADADWPQAERPGGDGNVKASCSQLALLKERRRCAVGGPGDFEIGSGGGKRCKTPPALSQADQVLQGLL
mmetsp:Transcript_32801/g.80467  ORF Transcript_32801/g.80467 Transcript_32801/m.80467 type:complete len:83 (+) Transcript_32801:820-1068(+)